MELAERRRAFGRALRNTAQLDASPVRTYLESIAAPPVDRVGIALASSR